MLTSMCMKGRINKKSESESEHKYDDRVYSVYSYWQTDLIEIDMVANFNRNRITN